MVHFHPSHNQRSVAPASCVPHSNCDPFFSASNFSSPHGSIGNTDVPKTLIELRHKPWLYSKESLARPQWHTGCFQPQHPIFQQSISIYSGVSFGTEVLHDCLLPGSMKLCHYCCNHFPPTQSCIAAAHLIVNGSFGVETRLNPICLGLPWPYPRAWNSR